jgi:competence ComEA-like helix-hairpin-helix protein
MWKQWFDDQSDWIRGLPYGPRERRTACLLMLFALGALLLFAVRVGHGGIRWIDIRDIESKQDTKQQNGLQQNGGQLAPVIVNINKAPWSEMTLLPGIGKTIAQRIVRHREEVGRFEAIDELVLIRGIGSNRLRKLRPNLIVE